MVKEIFVVPRKDLFPEGIFHGFVPKGLFDIYDKILQNGIYMERNDSLENDASFLQIIPYMWILNKKKKEVFLYQRAVGKDYKDTRHLDKYSGGIGGHADKEEIVEDVIIDALNREMREETIMETYPGFTFLGYLHREDDIYEKVHLGVLAIAETEGNVSPTDDGIKTGRFYTVEEVEELIKRKDIEFDKWTLTSWPIIKEHLLN